MKKNKLSFISGLTAFALLVSPFGTVSTYAESNQEEDVRNNVYHVTDDTYSVRDYVYYEDVDFGVTDDTYSVTDDIYSVTDHVYDVTDDVYGGVRDDVYGVTDDVYHVTDDVYGVTDDVYHVTDDVYSVTDDVYGVADYVYVELGDLHESATGGYVSLVQAQHTTFSKEALEALDPSFAINLSYGSVSVAVPVSLLLVGHDVTFSFNEVSADVLSKNSDALSALYDYKLSYVDDNGETQYISQFGNTPVMITFGVNSDAVTNWDNVTVLYIDQDGNKTSERVAADVAGGIAIGHVTHFSIYGVFEVAAADAPASEEEGTEAPASEEEGSEQSEEESAAPVAGKKDSDNSSKDSAAKGTEAKEGSKLPNTATATFNLLAFGVVLLLAGALLLLITARKSTTA
ncbi:hypothetical protein N0O92_01215 [Alkalihalobacillus sp. MEB130]|uniref:hypothetical protein n=1 Tax=Alkalihalobacillus sp. MEB130 TaxID=2976704 RepID=UPI0028DE1AA6|nr:hypothetical protein [Alkalihalobacillus sp. MEB130]MDT8858829.1 hypothetical protein [Alkalihalobacillus sp. MEB130]